MRGSCLRERSSTKVTPRVGIADMPAGDTCVNDWKRFCLVLREIASGDKGRPLSSLEAQQRAQAVLAECGYTWPGRAQTNEPVAAPVQEDFDTQPQVDAGSKEKSAAKAQSRSGGARGHRVESSSPTSSKPQP
jgi:hypothetical protein